MILAQAISVRVRLLLIVTAVLVAGFLTTNFVSFGISRANLKAALLENELPLTSSNIYSEIQVDLLRPVFVSSLMASDTFLRDWLLSGENSPEKVVRYLEEFRGKYGVFTSFLISDKTKNYYHFSGVARTVKEQDPDDAWFFRAKAMTKPYEINIDYNQEQDNALTVFVNYRVLDYQGKFIGITGVGLKIDTVARIISHYQEKFQRSVYFVDGSGRITLHSPNLAIVERNIHEARGIKGVADGILASTEGYFEYQRDGETMLLTTRFIPELGWHVVVEQRESTVLKGLWRGFLINLGIGFLIILLTIGVVGYTINLYQKRLEVMASVDKLTGVGNRQVFDWALEQTLKLLRRTPRPLSVILLDIDHFKKVNDTLGHLKGDLAIRKIADVVRDVIRESDLLCRWGGEEFIVLVDNCALDQAVALAESIRLAVADSPIFEPDEGYRLTVSLGVAEVTNDEDAISLVGRADRHLYQAKNEGRNRVAPAPVGAVVRRG